MTELPPQSPPPSSQTGAILLPLLLLIFTLALTAAGLVGRLLWNDADRSWPRLMRLAQTRSLGATATPTPSSANDPLLPSFTVDPALQSDYADLERQLLMPLRAYYATKEERLGPITVMPSDQGTHTTLVTFQIIEAGETREQRFYYDREGVDRTGEYPRWEPGLLDVTE